MSADIGPAGGTIAHPTGSIEVTFPAGALTETKRITIRPIESSAPNGVGQAFQVEPADLAFGQPVRVLVRVADSALGDLDPGGLGLAHRNPAGEWEARLDSKVTVPDQVSAWRASSGAPGTSAARAWVDDDLPPLPRGPITVVTFWRMQPRRATVVSNGTVDLQVQACIDSLSGVRLSLSCYPSIRSWAWDVSGIAGGSSAVGRVTPLTPASKARYQAPFLITTPATLVNATLVSTGPGSGRVLKSLIQLSPAGQWTGMIEYSYEGDTTFNTGVGTRREVRSGSGTIFLRALPNRMTPVGGVINAESWVATASRRVVTIENHQSGCGGRTVREEVVSGSAQGTPAPEDLTGTVSLQFDGQQYQLALAVFPPVDAPGTYTITVISRCSGEDEVVQTTSTDITTSEQPELSMLLLRDLDPSWTKLTEAVNLHFSAPWTWVKVRVSYDLRPPAFGS